MNTFSAVACTRAEQIGRDIFEKFLKKNKITEYVFSKGQFDVYDCIFKNSFNGKTYVVEIKNRAERYSKYNDMLIEKAKHDSVLAKAKEFNAEALYVNVYEGTNVVKVANLSTYGTIQWSNEYHQLTDLGNQELIVKQIAYLTKIKTFSI